MSLTEWGELHEEAGGELVRGRLQEEEVADPVHELAVTWLVFAIRGWLGGRGYVFGSELKLAIDEQHGRKPDLSVFLRPRALPRRGPVRVAPDIAVEVVTPTPADERRDRVDKMSEYARFGIHYYWLLDPALGSLEIFELDERQRYARVFVATRGSHDAIPGCQGLTLDLDALWDELARLEPDERDQRDPA